MKYLLIISSFLCFGKSSYQEIYRPLYHFSPAKNWINDPNGLFKDIEDRYHMFYQYNPYGDQWGHMSWGHAISNDLVHWKEQDVAILEEDGIMIYSGSAIVDYKNTTGFQPLDSPQIPYVAIYTGSSNLEQNQNLAFSIDGGSTWTKYEQNPVLRIPLEQNFRDPKVMWFEPTQKWIMIVSLSNQKKVQFYESSNLKEWTQTGEFSAPNIQSGVWECPDLFPLALESNEEIEKWIFVLNINPEGYQKGSGALYFIGNFDGKQFTVDDQYRQDFVDYGSDFYAVTSYFDYYGNSHKRTAIAWMSNWLYSGSIPTNPWRGQMSFPRDFKLKQYKDKLYLGSIPTFEDALEVIQKEQIFNYDVSQDEEQSLDTVNQLIESTLSSNAQEVLLNIEIAFKNQGKESSTTFGVEIASNYQNQFTDIGFSSTNKQNIVFVDRTQSGKVDFDQNFPYLNNVNVDFDIANEEDIKLQIIIDKNSVEAFYFDGLYSMTNLIFPNEANGIRIWITDQNQFKLQKISITTLASSMNSDIKSQVFSKPLVQNQFYN